MNEHPDHGKIVRAYSRIDVAAGLVELASVDPTTVILSASRGGGYDAYLGPEDIDALIHALKAHRAKMRIP